MEKWQDIVEHDGYQVNEDGVIKSYINNRHGIGTTSRILKQTLNKHGYATVQLGRGNRKLVHRLVAEAFIPNPNNLPLVRHKDDNPLNNNVNNLEWGTQTDNMQDCVRHGRLVGDTRAAIEATKTPVKAIPLNGEAPMIFESVQDAARKLHLWPQHISSATRGKISQTGGYKFERVDKEVV